MAVKDFHMKNVIKTQYIFTITYLEAVFTKHMDIF